MLLSFPERLTGVQGEWKLKTTLYFPPSPPPLSSHSITNRTNSQEAPSRASGSAGLAARIQKAGAGLEMRCEHGESTQISTNPLYWVHTREPLLLDEPSSPSEPEHHSRPSASTWIWGASPQAAVWMWPEPGPSSCRKTLRAFNSPKLAALFLPLTHTHVSGGHGHRKGSTSQINLLSLCKILPCQQVQQDTSAPREKCLEKGEWGCEALPPMSPKFGHL